MGVEPNFVKIGQNIKIMRIRKGVTQSELAEKTWYFSNTYE